MSNQEETEFIDIPEAELGNYVLLEKLGEGGMGAVFKAKHKVMGRVVAIKMISAAGMKDPKTVERFQREVRAAAKLHHPNIVGALDADQVGEQAFLVMDYVAGVDLAEWVKLYGPMSVELALNYLRQAGCGLEAAHQAGIVHRDIKPANLILDEMGVVKILDLGLARIEHEEEQQNLTNTGQVVGTVTFMSPEQALSTKHVDARTDMYSLGCTLYYLLTGSVPFKGETAMQTLMAHRLEPIPPLPGVSSEMQAVYFRMMAKQPQDRFANMTECLAALAALKQPAQQGKTSRLSDSTQENSDVALSNFMFAAAHAGNLSQASVDTSHAQLDLTVDRPAASVMPGRSWVRTPVGLMSLGGAAFVLLLTVVFMLRTPSGTLIIEIDQPGATVSVDGKQRVMIQQPGGKSAVQVEVDEKLHELKVTKNGFEIFTKQFSMNGEREQSIRVRLEPLEKPTAAIVKPVVQPQEVPKTSEPIVGNTPGQERDDNAMKMKFCWCPPGKFMMGSPEGELNREGARELQVEVELPQGLWMGKYEVTQAEYQKVMDSNPSIYSAEGANKTKLAALDVSKFPVENVSWPEATEFARRLTEQEQAGGRLPPGWEYRLPTEAEWEYACRAGTTTATSFGDKLSSKQANFKGTSPYNGAEVGPNLARPTTVGSYPANTWGLHDMHGNVWEWCRDLHDEKLSGGINPQGARWSPGVSNRVDRGGGWYDEGQYCRSANRIRSFPGLRYPDRGFRVAIGPVLKPPPVATIPTGQKAGDTWSANSFAIPFCWCPAGKFTMGSPAAEKERGNDEKQVEVTLSQGFWLGKYEVTQDQWVQVMRTNPWSGQKFVKEGLKVPASHITYQLANSFCVRFTAQEYLKGNLPATWKYQLPTEAQWEYACRAGSVTAFHFSNEDTLLNNYAWWGGWFADGDAFQEKRATDVGTKLPNAWGLHDMHGNVGEWCRDTYAPELPGGTNPLVFQNSNDHVSRGGGWSFRSNGCRSAVRLKLASQHSSDAQGFRIALVPGSPTPANPSSSEK